MKSKSILSLALLSALNAGVFAQGSLTPPAGPPAPVMKTLTEVYDKAAAAEARTPLVAGQPGVAISADGSITISKGGSYFLTDNLTITTNTFGIHIAADDVTLDLNGFSLICTTGAGGDAISVGLTYGGVSVRNGHIIGGTQTSGLTFVPAGWNNGITLPAAPFGKPSDASDISVRGVRASGFRMGENIGTSVTRCRVLVCGQIGIYASLVTDCTVYGSGSNGILVPDTHGSGLVSRCVAQSFGTGMEGISAAGNSVSDSRGESFGGGAGIFAETAINCIGRSRGGAGIGISADAATNCRGLSDGGIGLQAETATNCIGSSTSGPSAMNVVGTASYCRGTRSGGTAITAAIAVACTSGGGTITAPQKHLGTP